jgi:hypothetical protein
MHDEHKSRARQETGVPAPRSVGWDAVVAAANDVDEKLRGREVERPYWVQAGEHAWGLVVGGSVVALVYWTAAGVGELDERGGEPVPTEGGWFWFSVDDPDNHYDLGEGVELADDVTQEGLLAARDEALAAASKRILGQRGS